MSFTSGARTRFEQVFARAPEFSARAPGRINLIGEHVDYQGGVVIPAAIDRYVFADAAAIAEPEIRLWSAMWERAPLHIPIAELAPIDGVESWANYVIGVVAKYRDDGVPVRGFEIAFGGNLPLGAGMSSSAALEMATALIVEATAGIERSPVERALLCQAAEHEFARVPCGIMDQLAVGSGVASQALAIDCQSLEVMPIPLPENLAVVVVDSQVKHALADGEYAKRKEDCETASKILGVDTLRSAAPEEIDVAHQRLGKRVYRRARHVVTEIARVQQFMKALQSGDIHLAGELMAASHASLRDDYEVSCAELDALVEIAASLDVIGARMMGGGFGGSTVNLVHGQNSEAFAIEICRRYREELESDVKAFVVHAVDGAMLL